MEPYEKITIALSAVALFVSAVVGVGGLIVSIIALRKNKKTVHDTKELKTNVNSLMQNIFNGGIGNTVMQGVNSNNSPSSNNINSNNTTLFVQPYVNEEDEKLFKKIQEIIEPIYLYEKDTGFWFESSYPNLCPLAEFRLYFDNLHFTKDNAEQLWSRLKKAINDFSISGQDVISLECGPLEDCDNYTESNVKMWDRKYPGPNKPQWVKERIEKLEAKYPVILEELQALLETYSDLCRVYKANK